MEFTEQIQALSAKILKLRGQLSTEEATKNALVMPFIAALGYDVFDPGEVKPEFTADVGTKKGEKVDYAILHGGTLMMIFECKKFGTPLDVNQASQLYRYFAVSKARFAFLTDGAIYRVYTDLDEPNKMDLKPFLEVDLSNPQHPLVPELQRFSKSSFNLEETLEASKQLKYIGGIKSFLTEQMNVPGEELVRLFAAQVYDGQMREGVRKQFQDIVKRAIGEFIKDQVNDRLRSALNEGKDPSQTRAATATDQSDTSAFEPRTGREVVTLPDEWESYYIVKSILRPATDPRRIAIRDTKGYCGILLDDNNRKPLCRLYFNSSQKYLGLFDEQKQEKRHPIGDLSDIYGFSDHLQKTVALYDSGKMQDVKEPETEVAPNGGRSS